MIGIIKNTAASLALMAAIGTASAIPVIDVVDPSTDITITSGSSYTFTHDITDGYVAAFDELVSALLTISVIDNVNRGNEVFRFAIGTDATVQLYDGSNINNGNTGADFPIILVAALSDLSADGLLSVTLSATSGDYRFTHSVLSAEITRETTDSLQAAAVAVPEPGTLALLGLGIIGVSMMRKRKS